MLRGKVRSTTYNDDGTVRESVVLCQKDGLFGVDIPKTVWHKLESLESGSVVFECKASPYHPKWMRKWRRRRNEVLESRSEDLPLCLLAAVQTERKINNRS